MNRVVKIVLSVAFSLLCLLLCIGSPFLQGGLLFLLAAVLALPVKPIQNFWGKILPAKSPRFAGGAIIAALFIAGVVALPSSTTPASAPEPTPTATVEPAPTEEPTPEPTATAAPTATPNPTATPTPEPAATPEPTATAAPTAEPTAAPTAAPTEAPTPEPTAAPTSAPEPTVYIAGSGSGTKYHSHSSCSGMTDPVEVTLSQAQAWGYTPCKRCY